MRAKAKSRNAAFAFAILICVRSAAQASSSHTLPAGTAFTVESGARIPMKAGARIHATLLYPVYLSNALLLPEGTQVLGKVAALEPDSAARVHARLRGDFTPYHHPRAAFDQLVLPDGAVVPLSTNAPWLGAPILQIKAPSQNKHKSLPNRAWMYAREAAHRQIAFFTNPGFKTRALNLLYQQLPYHPEWVNARTAWSFELNQPLALPAFTASTPPPPPSSNDPFWHINALLTSEISSATAHQGDPVEAIVVEPVFDSTGALAVPQGATLIGKVAAAKHARAFSRDGQLRFTFQQVRYPAGALQSVSGSMTGAGTDRSQALEMDAEGGVKPRSQANALFPLALSVLAYHGLDSDGNLTANSTVASNGFGIVGRVTGIVAASRPVAAGIGFYAAALSSYDNFLKHGKNVVFQKDTRIEIETAPMHSPVLKPSTTTPKK